MIGCINMQNSKRIFFDIVSILIITFSHRGRWNLHNTRVSWFFFGYKTSWAPFLKDYVKMKHSTDEYVPCVDCFGLLKTASIWKHNCPAVRENLSRRDFVKRGKQFVASLKYGNSGGATAETLQRMWNFFFYNYKV